MDLHLGAVQAKAGTGVRMTFLGNTNVLISDGSTHLLVDGFFTRPGMVKTLLGRLSPDTVTISNELRKAGITSLDAVLVGHAHHDHALDSPVVAGLTHAKVMGSASYGFIHRGTNSGSDGGNLITVPEQGRQKKFGRFTVTFVPAAHVGSHSFLQRLVEGNIREVVKMPARFWRFKCGEAFAIHIAHPDGNIMIANSAGALAGQFHGKKADVVFLGVALLDKETREKQDSYWHEVVQTVNPQLIIPIHWDAFTRKLDRELKPLPRFADNVEAAIKLVKGKAKAEGRSVQVLDLHESLLLRNGVVQ